MWNALPQEAVNADNIDNSNSWHTSLYCSSNNRIPQTFLDSRNIKSLLILFIRAHSLCEIAFLKTCLWNIHWPPIHLRMRTNRQLRFMHVGDGLKTKRPRTTLSWWPLTALHVKVSKASKIAQRGSIPPERTALRREIETRLKAWKPAEHTASLT